jgi:hypothetical protein
VTSPASSQEDLAVSKPDCQATFWALAKPPRRTRRAWRKNQLLLVIFVIMAKQRETLLLRLSLNTGAHTISGDLEADEGDTVSIELEACLAGRCSKNAGRYPKRVPWKRLHDTFER